MRTVLFVCVENSFCCVLSEALFNTRAPPGWHADSAGVAPAAKIKPVVLGLLRERGIDGVSKRPRHVTPVLMERADRSITFGCLDRCPTGAEGKAEDWPLPGATGKSYEDLRGIRDELTRRMDLLIASLPPARPGDESS